MSAQPQPKHWIFRVGDGENFRNSKRPYWGVKRGKNDSILTVIKKIEEGSILWFMTSKEHGGKLIGMAEYTHYNDRKDEPLVSINTYSNDEQCWNGGEDWSIQIHYKNAYDIEDANIEMVIQCGATILDYETFRIKKSNMADLYMHAKYIKLYAQVKQFMMRDDETEEIR